MSASVRIHFVVNSHRPDAIHAAVAAAEFARDLGAQVQIEPSLAELMVFDTVSYKDIADADLIVSIGGDGTLIRSAHLASKRGTPILGVFFGRFGFVTQCSPEETNAALRDFVEGRLSIEERSMVRAELVRNGESLAVFHALNEATVQRTVMTRMLEFKISVQDQVLTHYPADGIVISTPTGSTAYNLSAGGPIVDPHLDLLILTPLAAHTLNSRSLIFNPTTNLEIGIGTRGDAILNCDGIDRMEVFNGDTIFVRQSERKTRLVQIDSRDFLSKLSDRILSKTFYYEGDQE